MSKKNKKKKPQVSAKLQQAQKFNDFKKRLLLNAKACGAEQAFKLLPKREIEYMFFVRFKPFDLIPIEGQELASSNYKILKQIVSQHGRQFSHHKNRFSANAILQKAMQYLIGVMSH